MTIAYSQSPDTYSRCGITASGNEVLDNEMCHWNVSFWFIDISYLWCAFGEQIRNRDAHKPSVLLES